MYDAVDLAKYVVTKCVHDSEPISNLQLQKILYFIQKEFVKIGEYAFIDPIEAWQFGPVVPIAYYYFCGSGAMPILFTYDVDIEDKDRRLIDNTIEKRRRMGIWELVDETHKPGGAWDRVYDGGKGLRKVIPISYIREEG